MEVVLDIANRWVGLLGGLSAIITALFFFLQKAHFSRLESELNTTRDKLGKILDGEVHAKKKIFDKEFKIYEDIWDLITDLERKTHEMLTMFEAFDEGVESRKAKMELKVEYVQFYNHVNYATRKCAPFLPADIYELIGKKLGSFKWTIQTVEVQNDDEEYIKFLDQSIADIREQISIKMKEHVQNIKIT